MWTRRRIVLLAALAVVWLAFVVVDLLNGWHSYYVAISFALILTGQLIVPHKPRSAAPDPGPQGPWPEKALLPELRRRRKAAREE